MTAPELVPDQQALARVGDNVRERLTAAGLMPA